MNQIVIDNRQKIASACSRCFSALDGYARACNDFRAEQKRIEPLPYIQEEKERMVSEAAKKLGSVASTKYEEIRKNLDDIKEAAEEMAAILDIGQDFQNTLSLVKQMGSDLPVDVRYALIAPFKGQKRALEILKAAYESAGMSPEPYFKGLIFAPGSRISALDADVYRITVQPGDHLLVAATFANGLESLADDLGVELSTRFKDMTDLSAAYTAAMYKACGVDM